MRTDLKDDVTTLAAVAAVGSALRLKLGTVKTGAAVAAVACPNVNLDSIYEHCVMLAPVFGVPFFVDTWRNL